MLDTIIRKHYYANRKPLNTPIFQQQTRANNALNAARRRASIERDWYNLAGRIFEDDFKLADPEAPKSVRLRIVPDEFADLDSLLGGMFDPEVVGRYPGGARRLEKEKQDYIEKIEQDGVWGIIAEYWNGESWQETDSCWGFVGNDWKEDLLDFESAAMIAYRAQLHCPTCGRPKLPTAPF